MHGFVYECETLRRALQDGYQLVFTSPLVTAERGTTYYTSLQGENSACLLDEHLEEAVSRSTQEDSSNSLTPDDPLGDVLEYYFVAHWPLLQLSQELLNACDDSCPVQVQVSDIVRSSWAQQNNSCKNRGQAHA